MNSKFFVCLLAAVLPITAYLAEAQQRAKLASIGYLSGPGPSVNASRMEALRQGLRELGYVEGKNILIEWRFAEGKLDRLPALAAELVRLNVQIIVTSGGTPTRAARAATATIPIIMTSDPDPVRNGFVASLARPGGNVTGLSTFAPELSGKRLEILREVVPQLSRVAVLGTSIDPGYGQMSKEIDLAAKQLGIKLQYLDVLDATIFETPFRAAIKGRADGVLTLSGGGVLTSQRAQLAELAVKYRLPLIYPDSRYVVAGGLMSYGVNVRDLDRRAATFVDKILNGRTPRDLPVEQPIKFEFIVNLPAAKKVGLTIPPNVLVRADKVIR